MLTRMGMAREAEQKLFGVMIDAKKLLMKLRRD